MLPTTENEKTSLEAHVDLCALRYQDLDSRLIRLEAKLDGIDTKIDTFKAEIAWMLIKGGASIIVLLLGAIGTILKLLGHF
jgi:hypothetical protein